MAKSDSDVFFLRQTRMTDIIEAVARAIYQTFDGFPEYARAQMNNHIAEACAADALAVATPIITESAERHMLLCMMDQTDDPIVGKFLRMIAERRGITLDGDGNVGQ